MSFKSEQAVRAVMETVEKVVWVFNVYVCMQMNFALNAKSERPVVTCLCITVCPCNRSRLYLSYGCVGFIKPVIQVAGRNVSSGDVSCLSFAITSSTVVYPFMPTMKY